MTGARDYIVVGAGSGGCTVAARLIEGGARVTLLEAGPRDRNPLIHIPAGVRHLLNHPTLNWNFASEPEAGTAGRPIHWPRGRTLGGSSAINGMLYVRGNAPTTTVGAIGLPGVELPGRAALFQEIRKRDHRRRHLPRAQRPAEWGMAICRSLTSSSPPPRGRFRL